MALLDVREDLKQGRPPIKRITDAVALLAPDETLVLVTPFEPIPLIAMMKGNGFSHQTRQVASAHWKTEFTPSPASIAEEPEVEATSIERSDSVVEIDARGCEPPQPMMRILSALDNLEEGCALRAFTERRPLHLLDALSERGFLWDCFEEKPNGSWITLIWRA